MKASFSRKALSVFTASFVLLTMARICRAAEIRVYASGAMAGTVREIAKDFTARTGNAVVIVEDTTGGILRRLRAGEKADAVVAAAQAVDQLIDEHIAVETDRVALARGLVAVGISARAQKRPDISSPEKFKTALLEARSVSYVSPAAGGTSGIYFEGLLQRMGVAEAMKPKTVYRTQGAEVTEAIAEGQAELGITFGAELLPNKDVVVLGLLPPELQNPTIYVGAITASSKGDGALALLQEAQTPRSRDLITKAGLESLPAIVKSQDPN